jgi:putative membrane protein insertion efficiency factor
MRFIALLSIRGYKLIISPILAALGVRCNHAPSCSDYTAQAIRQHGFWAGGWMGLARIVRCHPWGTHGHDPVPDEASGSWWRPWTYGRWR